MKILMLEWDSFGNVYIKDAFTRAGYTVVSMKWTNKEDTIASEELATNVVKKIQETKAEVLFSFNYFPVAAIAASACRIKYISWTYDSPYLQIYNKTIELPCNYAFIFDKSEYINLRSKGINSVYYLPMAADTEYYDRIEISENEREKYTSDVAMIGSMYTENRHNLFRHFEGLDKYTDGYIKGLMDAQKQLYGVSVLEKGLTPEIVKNIQKVCPMVSRGDGFESVEWSLANYFIARKLTSIERQEMISALAEKFDVALYTPESTGQIPKARNMGTVEYYKDSPKAIKCAKINLNITLRSIITGIPLRCIDIMGCGGFLLTNYQADFDEYFENGVDYVFYEDKQDMVSKVEYYLSHDDERMAIAKSGYKKIKTMHNFDKRVEEMMRIAEILK